MPSPSEPVPAGVAAVRPITEPASVPVRFLCSWGEDSLSLGRRYACQTPGGAGCWGPLRLAKPGEVPALTVVMEDLPDGMDPRQIDPANTLFLSREPPWIRSGKSWLGVPGLQGLDYSSSHQACVWWVRADYDALTRLEYPFKSKRLCTIVSGKRSAPGHRLRLDFLRKLVEVHPTRIDVFGRGLEKESLGSAWKGPVEDKLAAAFDYAYCLVLENGVLENYFTEKLADAMLSWCYPLYWGCPNLADFLPEDSFLPLDISDPIGSIWRVIDATNHPPSMVQREALGIAREQLLNRYNLWSTVQDAWERRIRPRISAVPAG